MVQAENFNTMQVNFSFSRVKQKETKHATQNKTISLCHWMNEWMNENNGINYFIVSIETQGDVITIRKKKSYNYYAVCTLC